MQTIELNRFGLIPMSLSDMEETDGGFVWFLVIAACALLSGCGNGSGNQVNSFNGDHNNNTSHFSQDSVQNSSSAHGSLQVPLPGKK